MITTDLVLESIAPATFTLLHGPVDTAALPTDAEWLLWVDHKQVRGALLTATASRLVQHGLSWSDLPWERVIVVPISINPLTLLSDLRASIVAFLDSNGGIEKIATSQSLLLWLFAAYLRLYAQHETTLEATNDAITIVSAEQTVLGWNWAAERLFGYREATIVGQPHTDFFDPDRQWCMRVLKTGEEVRQLVHIPKDGVNVIINSLPIVCDGKIVGAVSAEQDVTQFVRLQALLIEANSRMTYLENEVERLRQVDDPFRRIVGRSTLRNQLVSRIRKASITSATVLIRGESGTGKELVAMALHEAGDRASKPFMIINCGAIPAALFESELFGYEGGAFTGADRRGKKGLLEEADGGTLFLDEVGDLPLEMQVKLLRVLEEQTFYRVGSSQPRRVNVRFIAATNRDLEHMIEREVFREDLFYRLRVVTIQVPPLRERLEDLPDLIHLFLHEFSVRYGKQIRSIDPSVIHALLGYDWPGNIRELKNVIEQLVVLAEDGVVQPENLPPEFLRWIQLDHNLISLETARIENADAPSASHGLNMPETAPIPLDQAMQDAERLAILAALARCRGNKAEAARYLGISRPTLYAKLKRLGPIAKDKDD